MRVRPCGDGHDQRRALARVPFDAVPHLQDRDAVAQDQVAILDHAMGDGDPLAQIGVRGGLAPLHAGAEAGLDAAIGHQQRGSLGNRIGLVRDAGIQAHKFAGQKARFLNQGHWFLPIS